jgi:hypothetical protein
VERKEEVIPEFKRAIVEAYDKELSEVRAKGIVDFFFVFVAIFSGALCMMYIEEWTWEQSLYWACVTVIRSLFVCLVSPFSVL